MNAVAEVLKDANEDSQQFLTFKLAGEEYGVGILAVAHWLDWEFHLTAWAFLAAAAIALFPLRGSPHLAMAISFGAIHAVLGLSRYVRERP